MELKPITNPAAPPFTATSLQTLCPAFSSCLTSPVFFFSRVLQLCWRIVFFHPASALLDHVKLATIPVKVLVNFCSGCWGPFHQRRPGMSVSFFNFLCCCSEYVCFEHLLWGAAASSLKVWLTVHNRWSPPPSPSSCFSTMCELQRLCVMVQQRRQKVRMMNVCMLEREKYSQGSYTHTHTHKA